MNEKRTIKYTWYFNESPSILLEFNKLRFNYSHFSHMWKNSSEANPIEFLPGIFYQEENNYSCLCKSYVIHILNFLSQKVRIPLPSKLKKYFIKIIQIEIINYRDSINLRINDTIEFARMAKFDDQMEIDKYLQFECGNDYTAHLNKFPQQKFCILLLPVVMETDAIL